MKSATLLLVLLFITTFSARSQTHNNREAIEPIGDSRFAIGPKGGFGHSFFFPYSNCGFNATWNVGLTSIYSPWQHWGFGLDASFSTEGVTFTDSDLSYKIQLDYLRLPVKLIYFFRSYEKDFRPRLHIGPSLGILLDQPENSKGYNTTDWGANAGLGFNYRLLRGFWLSMDANYYQGFKDIYIPNSENDRNGNVRLEMALMVGF